jgi:hypothetical protein
MLDKIKCYLKDHSHKLLLCTGIVSCFVLLFIGVGLLSEQNIGQKITDNSIVKTLVDHLTIDKSNKSSSNKQVASQKPDTGSSTTTTNGDTNNPDITAQTPASSDFKDYVLNNMEERGPWVAKADGSAIIYAKDDLSSSPIKTEIHQLNLTAKTDAKLLSIDKPCQLIGWNGNEQNVLVLDSEQKTYSVNLDSKEVTLKAK